MPLNDFRFAFRAMRKAPGFTAAAALTMALAIAGATTIFSVVNAVMLRALPYSQPEQLLQMAEKNDKLHLPQFAVSALNYLSWKEQFRCFEDMAAMGQANFNLVGGGEPEHYSGNTVTASMLRVLRLKPLAGRAFQEGDDRPGAPRVAMISEGLWRKRFGGDPAAVGKPLTLNGLSYTLIGVAPAELPLLTNGDIWVPLVIDPAREIRLSHLLQVVGRLKPGVSLSQALAEAQTVEARMVAAYPEINGWGIRLITFEDTFVPSSLRRALWVLLGAVCCVLLIACANVANLLLARAVGRRREIAVRLAIGAGRGRLIRQLVSESLALSLLGGLMGIAVALATIQMLPRLLPDGLLPFPSIPVDATVMLFALGVTVLTGVLFGAAPAVQASRTDLNELLKYGARAGGSTRAITRKALVAGELALATVLLVGAGLLMRSLFALEGVKLGYEPRNTLTFQLTPPAAKYSGAARGWAFYREFLTRVQALPGVRSAAITSGIPMGAGNYTATPAWAEGSSALPPGTTIPLEWRIVSPGYLRTMSIPLLKGRNFTEQEPESAAPPVIVTAEAASKFWGNADPMGRTIAMSANRRFTVVGVAGGVRANALSEEPAPAMYLPSSYRIWPLMEVVVRTHGKPEALLPSVRRALRELDPEMPLSKVRTLEQWVALNAAQPRLNATLLGIFAALALLIAAIGVYGVLAYSVTQRAREIGLRMALGAGRANVVKLVVKEGMTVGVAGVLAGMAAAWAMARVVARMLYDVSMRDTVTYVSVVVVLILVAAVACAVPAYRASKVDPMVALREE